MSSRTVEREIFLEERRQALFQTQEYMKAHPDSGVIVCDPEDDIVCDFCNGEIEEQYIHINDWGAKCPACRGEK